MEPREYATMFALEEGHWWYRSLRRRLLRTLRRVTADPSSLPPAATGDPRERRICLDAGCGSGMLLASLPPPWTGHGCDLSLAALRFAQQRGARHLARSRVEQLPVVSGRADLIISADVIYHRDVPDDVAALREMARCLRPGGWLILNLPAFGWLYSAHDRAIHTARRYTAGQLRQKLRQAGLTPLRVRYWNWLLFPPIAVVRLARRGATVAAAPASDLRPLPALLNSLLDRLLRIEEWLDAVPIPFGLSVMAVARKEPDATRR
jgi:SAM-dependent methyltransferase